jgi:diguanylate cyclase (GGDEF)-like protein
LVEASSRAPPAAAAAAAESVQAEQALVERVLSEGFHGLRFPAELERAFIIHTADERTIKLIVAALNSILVFSGILIADYLMIPGDMALAAGLRIGVYAPLVLGATYLFHRLSYPALNEWMAALIGLLCSGITMVLTLKGHGPFAYTIVVELLLVITYMSLFARFWPLVLLCSGTALMHVLVAAQVLDVIGTVRLGSGLMLCTTILFSLVASYRLEHNERLAFLHGLREQALSASVNAANLRLSAMARTDPLTGVDNRRSFDDFVDHSWRRACELGQVMSLMLIDIDHFKAYNDLYGHQAGDQCLCKVAEAVSTCLRRPVDLLARWGGEEFAVVITDADPKTAEQVAVRILQAVESSAMVHAGSSAAKVVTVSVGMAAMVPWLGDDQRSLMLKADEALYRAKASGRNRVCVDVPGSAVDARTSGPEPIKHGVAVT